MKKVGKTTRPLRYDLNQIHYNYTVEVTSTFKELDLIDRVPEELWMEVCNIVWEANAGDPGSIPGSGRSLVEGNGYPRQYSCLENPMDRGVWWATVHGVAKESDMTE